MAAEAGDDANVTVRIEDIIERIRRDVEAASRGGATEAAPADADALPPVSSRPELEYLNRHWSLFDPLSEMRSHRRFLGSVVLRFKSTFRRLVIGVLDRYFEKERLLLLELVRFNNALAERSDRLLRELTERTKAVAERNDLFLGALDLRVEALEAAAEMRRGGEPTPPQSSSTHGREELRAEMAAALGDGVGERVRSCAKTLPADGPILVLGCGAGDVLEALREKWPDLRGVESSDALVRQCRGRGFAVERAALPQALESLPEASLAGLVVSTPRRPLWRSRLARAGRRHLAGASAGGRGRLRGHSRRVRPPFLAARAAALRDRRSARLSCRGLAGDRARDRRPPSQRRMSGAARPPLAFVSPLPPVRSGISDYAADLLPHVTEDFTIEVFVDERHPLLREGVYHSFPVHPPQELRRRVGEFAHVVYQMGNNLHHRFVLELAREIPGILVLHDVVLHHLYEGIAGIEDAWDAYGRALRDSYGSVGERVLSMKRWRLASEREFRIAALRIAGRVEPGGRRA